MNISDLTFQLKDVIIIAGGIITLAGVYFPLQHKSKLHEKELTDHKVAYTSNMLSFRSEMETKINHANTDRKSDLVSVYDQMQQNKSEIKTMINEVKQEQKEDYGKLSTQISSMATNINEVGRNVSELTGWVKSIKQNNK